MSDDIYLAGIKEYRYGIDLIIGSHLILRQEENYVGVNSSI